MEIAPVTGIRVTPTVKVRPVGPELTASFDIESAARPGDDTYTRSGKKAAGAEESEEENEEVEAETVEDESDAASTTRGAISIFA
jgi:hypothetical protein